MPYVGLGDDSTPLATFSFDPASWDWHEWALAALGVFVVGKVIFGGVKSRVVDPLGRRIKKRKRSRERLESARKSYERAQKEASWF